MTRWLTMRQPTAHQSYIRATGLKNSFFRKRKVFKGDLKELTQVECRTEVASWFQISGVW